MKRLLLPVKARPRMTFALLLGLSAACLLPAETRQVTRWLTGWNVGVWTYLLLMGWLMVRADHDRLHRIVRAQADSAGVVLALLLGAAVASVLALGWELVRVKQTGAAQAAPQLLLAVGTLLGAWLLVPVIFTMTYASHWLRGAAEPGLRFPDASADFRPQYSDFLYVAVTIAVAAQTADVAVTSRRMRQLVLLQSVVSFAFNTTILAFAINVAASLF